MLTCNHITVLNHRFQVLENRASKTLSEDMQFLDCCIELCQVFPAGIVAFNVILMQAVENGDFVRAGVG